MPPGIGQPLPERFSRSNIRGHDQRRSHTSLGDKGQVSPVESNRADSAPPSSKEQPSQDDASCACHHLRFRLRHSCDKHVGCYVPEGTIFRKHLMSSSLRDKSARAKIMTGCDPLEEMGSWMLRLKRNVLDSDREELAVRLEKFLCQEREAEAMDTEDDWHQEITKLDEGTIRTQTTSSRSIQVEVLCCRYRHEEAKETVQRSLTGKRDDSLVPQHDVVDAAYSTACVEAEIWFSEMNKIESEDPGSRRIPWNARVQTDDVESDDSDGLPQRPQGSRRTQSSSKVQTDTIEFESEDGSNQGQESRWTQSSVRVVLMDTVEREESDRSNREQGSRWTRSNARVVQRDPIETEDPERRIRGRASGRGIKQVASGKEATERRRMGSWTDYLIYWCVWFSLPLIISLVIVYLVIFERRSERLIPA